MGSSLLLDKLSGAMAQVRYVPRVLRLVARASPRWTIAWIALLLAQGLVPVALVYLSRPLVDRLAAAIASGGGADALLGLLPVAVAIAVTILAAELLRAADEWVRTVQARRVEDHVSGLVHAQSAAVDLAFYESPDFHDHLHRAREEARYRPVTLLENLGGLLQHGITLVAMAGVLASFGWWLSAALLASTLPALVVVLRHALAQHRWRRRTTTDERRAAYQDWLLTSRETAAEVRLLDLGAGVRSAYQEIRARLRGEEARLGREHLLAEAAAAAVALALAAACVAWVLWQAVHGAASLGDVALFYLAFNQGQRLMRTLLGGVGQVYYNLLFLGNLFEYLDLRPALVDPNPARVPARRDRLAVAFREAAFRYPGSERMALDHLELECRPGQVAAIVGTNGAGKTTLLKLLCRLYDVDAGSVEVGGIDVREWPLAALRASVAVLFQEPVRYDDTAARNIAMGCPDATRAEIEAAARAAGADALIERLPRGYETPLGRWFAGGVELSVGEWQRIALARAFLRPAPILLLDEPTSAMDSWAEADWLQRFRNLAAGRTAIVITHRFTTAMQADVIHVMHGGRIVESGSHLQLVHRRGAYARSWQAQARVEEGSAA